MVWLGFIISLVILISVAIKNLYLALLLGALSLGFFNLSPGNLGSVILRTVGDPSIILLAVSVSLIPIIGGVMEESHLMESLVQNLRVGKKGSLMLSPALFGMLPMPGGALLSAPLVEGVGEGISGEIKSAINVWFRHLLIFIYPLGALLPTTKMAGLNLYRELIYLLPFFAVIFSTGYFFLINRVQGNIEYKDSFSLKGLLVPLGVIMIAPLIHFTLMRFFELSEIPLLIGVSTSLTIALMVSGLKFKKLWKVAKKMDFWKFGLIIIGMFLFLNVFQASRTTEVIADVAFSRTFLLVGVGAFLAFVTGRIQVPISILIPIYFAKYGDYSITPFIFAIMFFSVFMGYVISPIHPCVAVSIEYFESNLKDFMKKMVIPTVISLVIAGLVAFIYFNNIL